MKNLDKLLEELNGTVEGTLGILPPEQKESIIELIKYLDNNGFVVEFDYEDSKTKEWKYRRGVVTSKIYEMIEARGGKTVGESGKVNWVSESIHNGEEPQDVRIFRSVSKKGEASWNFRMFPNVEDASGFSEYPKIFKLDRIRNLKILEKSC